MADAASGNVSADAASPKARALASRRWFYLWALVVLGVAAVGVVPGWHIRGGPLDPAALVARGVHVSRTTAVIDSAILVFREGLETILVLAAVTASFLGANRVHRKPVALGGALALAATVETWLLAICLLGWLGGIG